MSDHVRNNMDSGIQLSGHDISPSRQKRAIVDVKVDKYMVRPRHVSNQSLSYMFHSTSNLVHSWFSKEKDPPQEEEVEEPQRRTSAKF